MTPQAMRAPALPVVLLSSWPPRPKSSGSACTTRVRPIMLLGPLKEIKVSWMHTCNSNVAVIAHRNRRTASVSLLIIFNTFFPKLLSVVWKIYDHTFVAAPPEDSMLPRSPTWRMAASGPPCSILLGLKWAPADVHPFVLSPNSWMWKPCLPWKYCHS